MADQTARGGFVLSLDFELMWGVRDSRSLADYGPNLLGARAAIPRLLERFAASGIRCTWATVGMLFFARRDDLMDALPTLRPGYADPRLSPYGDLDRVGASEAADPYHFGLSLIREIAAAPGQEIATHSFSHFYCLEPGATRAAFAADLAAARAAAAAEGIRLRSIVFPRNQVCAEGLAACREAGIGIFRGNEDHRFYRAEAASTESLAKRAGRLADSYVNISGRHGHRPRRVAGLVDIPASRFLRPWSRRLAPLEGLRMGRILGAMRAAATAGEIFHLWFHPHNFGANAEANFAVLDRILAEAVRLRAAHGWPALTMAEAAEAA
ncbi:polysaccharide deacetylase family protein [Paralimibaculum aggregatum]|uniref:Polysaccharide deacetylase family protein n=1 Tax=Paralimibaculum aggregatum TaxID=3036245 RepID=A0ABQ6LKU1_9RHOB|nr:hypothetical protein [Limibaculum sp. NKW23]GMG80905.1 polysaccharide deacetylase family protein [Limibaculum sp. NKW23]